MLIAGTLEWAWTAAVPIRQRMALGQPWKRKAAASALVFETRALRRRYRQRQKL